MAAELGLCERFTGEREGANQGKRKGEGELRGVPGRLQKVEGEAGGGSGGLQSEQEVAGQSAMRPTRRCFLSVRRRQRQFA
jgi:hypothetical protein